MEEALAAENWNMERLMQENQALHTRLYPSINRFLGVLCDNQKQLTPFKTKLSDIHVSMCMGNNVWGPEPNLTLEYLTNTLEGDELLRTYIKHRNTLIKSGQSNQLTILQVSA